MNNILWHIIASALLLCVFSTTAYSEEKHKIGIGYEFGGAHVDDDTVLGKLDDNSIGHLSLTYEYSFNEKFAVELFALDGDTQSFSIILDDLFSKSELEYKSFGIGLRAQQALTKRINLFAKAGMHRYDYELTRTDVLLNDSDGFSYYASAGIEFQFYDFGVNVNYRLLDMGNEIFASVLAWGVSYRF
ncbi:porin family protein [Agaribacter flavus]|uniref:Porin family protein n=1 Tax=Agaribacter flavus TaxID=1902781 RepID=A0ABV7FTM8_9ALTE